MCLVTGNHAAALEDTIEECISRTFAGRARLIVHAELGRTVEASQAIEPGETLLLESPLLGQYAVHHALRTQRIKLVNLPVEVESAFPEAYSRCFACPWPRKAPPTNVLQLLEGQSPMEFPLT